MGWISQGYNYWGIITVLSSWLRLRLLPPGDWQSEIQGDHQANNQVIRERRAKISNHNIPQIKSAKRDSKSNIYILKNAPSPCPTPLKLVWSNVPPSLQASNVIVDDRRRNCSNRKYLLASASIYNISPGEFKLNFVLSQLLTTHSPLYWRPDLPRDPQLSSHWRPGSVLFT